MDISSVLHTVKHSGAKSRRKRDLPTYILFGFLLKLQLYMQKTKADVCVFARDSHPDQSIRKKIFPGYKIKRNSREKTEAEKTLDAIAYPQFNTVAEEILPAMGFRNIFYTERLEADDIIGSICKTYNHCEIIIVTSDHDMYQCLTDTTCILDPKTVKNFTKAMFVKKYGISPNMWKRVKAIGGCSSDEVPGVYKVAEKTVLKYLKGELPPHYQTYKAIKSEEGQKIINRNKSLVILPFRGTPKYHIQEDTVSKIKVKGVANKYGFKAISTDLERWTRILKGWG